MASRKKLEVFEEQSLRGGGVREISEKSRRKKNFGNFREDEDFDQGKRIGSLALVDDESSGRRRVGVSGGFGEVIFGGFFGCERGAGDGMGLRP